MRFGMQLGSFLTASCFCLCTYASVRANTIPGNNETLAQPAQQQIQAQVQAQQPQQTSAPSSNQPNQMNQPSVENSNSNVNENSANFLSVQPSPLKPAPAPTPATPSQPNSASASNALNDSEITTQVQAMIMGNSSMLGANIQVVTHDGNVTLNGTANSAAQVDDAIKTAKSIYGVKNVTSNVRVEANPNPNP